MFEHEKLDQQTGGNIHLYAWNDFKALQQKTFECLKESLKLQIIRCEHKPSLGVISQLYRNPEATEKYSTILFCFCTILVIWSVVIGGGSVTWLPQKPSLPACRSMRRSIKARVQARSATTSASGWRFRVTSTRWIESKLQWIYIYFVQQYSCFCKKSDMLPPEHHTLT